MRILSSIGNKKEQKLIGLKVRSVPAHRIQVLTPCLLVLLVLVAVVDGWSGEHRINVLMLNLQAITSHLSS